MSAVASQATITPEDLLKMPEGDRYELVNGQLVERQMSLPSAYTSGRCLQMLGTHNDPTKAGLVLASDVGYQCFPDDPTRVRRSDASFIRWSRVHGSPPSRGRLRIPPDLAIEVVSPTDLAYEMDAKVDEYLAAGVALVWVINPESRTVTVHRHDGTVARLHEADDLCGEAVLPGFRCRVADLFLPSLTAAEPPNGR